MIELQIFKNEKFGEIRVITKNGELWFVANDACRILELGDTSKAVSRLDEDEKGANSIPTPGGTQNMLMVNEPGLYSLVLGSRKPEAKEFKRWLTHEVIPALRKTGTYFIKPFKPHYYRGKNVVTIREIAKLAGKPENTVQYHIRGKRAKCKEGTDYHVLKGDELRAYKKENSIKLDAMSSLTVVLESGFRKLCKLWNVSLDKMLFQNAPVPARPEKPKILSSMQAKELCELKVQKQILKAKKSLDVVEFALDIFSTSYRFEGSVKKASDTLLFLAVQSLTEVTEVIRRSDEYAPNRIS